MALAAWLVLGAPAGAATLLDTSEVVAANAESAALLPPSHEFTLATAGTYAVTLKDLGVMPSLRDPADLTEIPALQSLQALVTRDLQVVARLQIEYPGQAGVAQLPVTQTFAGTPGTYRVHVLGAIAANQEGGFYSVDVAPSAGGAAVFGVVAPIAIQNGPPPEQSVLQTTFTVPVAGTYRVRAVDRSFPTALTTRDVLVLQTAPQIRVGVENSGVFSPGDVGTFTAQAGDTYELIIIAAAGTGTAGLYGTMVQNVSSGAVIYRSEQGVGPLPPARTLTIANTTTHTLTLADLQFPEALSSFSAAVIQNDAFVGRVDGATPGHLALSAGPAQLFVYATTSSTGAVSATLSDGTAQPVYADVHITDASPDVTTAAIYSFSSTDPVSAGTYSFTLKDLGFPADLRGLGAAIVQGATLVDRSLEPGTTPVTLQAGKVRVLVGAIPPPMSGTLPGNGAFALSLKAPSSNATVLESTRGIGGLFTSRILNVPAAGRYDISLKDFEFPSRLRVSWLAVTHDTELVGQVIGSSSIQNLQLGAGVHVLNFLGQPAANSGYGTFGLKVADSVPPPVVTLSASPTSVSSGQSTTLTWSASNATSCSASNGWTGTRAVSGTEVIGPFTGSATFVLECVGPSGRNTASVTVSLNASASGGGKQGGGGGSMDPVWLVALLTLTLATERRRSILR